MKTLPKNIEHYAAEILPKMEGWCTTEKAMILAGLVIERRPELCVEIGIFGGRSLLAMSLALAHNKRGVAWGIDPWTITSAVEGDVGEDNYQWWASKVDMEKIYAGFVKSAMDLDQGFYCRWIRERSEFANVLFKDRSVDVFHQDSNHSQLVSVRDVWLWAPKMKDHSVWVIDDADWGSQQKALEMIKREGFRLTGNHTQWHVYER